MLYKVIQSYTKLYTLTSWYIMVFTHFGLCDVMSGDVGASNNSGSSSVTAVTGGLKQYKMLTI